MRFARLGLCVMACAVQAQTVPKVRNVAEFAVRRLPGAELQIIDARQAPANGLDQVAAHLEHFCQIPFKVVKKPAEKGDNGLSLAKAALSRPKEVGAVVVVVDEGEDAPRLALYPEDRFGVINATRIRAGTDEKTAAARLEKELWRAVAFIAGGVASEEPCVVKTVLTPADLDALAVSTFSPMVAMKISRSGDRFGFGKIERTSYRAACLQGWAPAPTNDIQKAIWDRAQIK